MEANENDLRHMARAMFNAYNDEGPNAWKTFDGRQVPHWSDLTDDVRAKWIAAAKSAFYFVRGIAPEHRT